jgi:hypothetical protein
VREAGATSGFLGYFATYHVYPYYPDFMNLDPGYAAHRDRHGACSYAGYLKDLKAHTPELPILLGEYGVPSSRGIAHLQPQGIHHGGASEDEQGDRDARLLEDIVDSGCAGSLLFALYDEWFKVNWLVRKMDAPADRDPIWHNLLDPEENYGLISFDPPSPIRIDGLTDDWAGIAPYAEAQLTPLRAFYVTSDQARLFLRIDYAPEDWLWLARSLGALKPSGTTPRAPGGGIRALGVSFDILDPKRGDSRLPAPLQATWSRGAEFVLVVEPPRPDPHSATFTRSGRRPGGRAALFIDRSMNYSQHAGFLTSKGFEWNTAPFRPAANSDGRYAPLVIETNRERVGSDGTRYPAQYLNWGRLERGTEPGIEPGWTWPGADSGRAYNPHAEWEVNADNGVIEVAIPWGLLNVGDPSSLAVVDDKPDTRDTETTKTDGIALLAWATAAPGFVADSTGPAAPDAKPASAALCWYLGPQGTSQTTATKTDRPAEITTPSGALYLWNGWNTPITKEHIKRSAGRIRQDFEGMEAREKRLRSSWNRGAR